MRADRLEKEKIEAIIGECDNTIIVMDEVDSTNLEIKRLAQDGAKDGTVVIADRQSSGRGRLGRSFFSPAGSGIYMSILIKPSFEEERAVIVTTAVSVAVCRAIEKVSGKRPLIKWVNDLYLNGKKICGILTEAIRDARSGKIEYIVIGIGVNCAETEFPDDIKNIAGSICEKEEELSRNELAAEIIKEINLMGNLANSRDFIDEYKRRSLVIGKDIRIIGKSEELATVLDIDENGGLVVRLWDGETKILSSGEISIRLSGNNE
ncbi:MAG: biotin--[Clostridia bacterium]|nr:biotin--[acetyl-CoA-carboxylase] ligase [Clostridia bacterium]